MTELIQCNLLCECTQCSMFSMFSQQRATSTQLVTLLGEAITLAQELSHGDKMQPGEEEKTPEQNMLQL